MTLNERPAWRRTMRTLLGIAALLAAFATPPAAIGGLRAISYLRGVYGEPAVTDVPAELRDVRPAYNAAKPTAVVLVSNAGANAADTLAPYETLAATGALNLYTVAPQRRLVTLTGGLDLVPDLDFAELAQLLAGRAPDLVLVPAVPDPTGDTSATLRAWLGRTARAGAVVLSICEGAKVVAEAGVMDGHTATSHWLRVSGLAERHPQVRWVRHVRYVDDGDLISTGGVLSGIDGALRYIERTLGGSAAAKAAADIGWTAYSPGTPAPLPSWSFGAREMIAGVNLSFRPHSDIGVVLDDGIGEIELAAVFIAYSDVSYIARTHTLGRASAAPIRSRHGLAFVPRGSASDPADFDRVLIPAAAATRAPDATFDARVRAASGVTPEYLQAAPGFAFEAVLRDMARTVDVPTAQWRAKTLEYPVGGVDLTGPGWPWLPTVRPFLYGLIGLAVALAARWTFRARRRTGSTAMPAPALDPPCDGDRRPGVVSASIS
jgi:putative intracellular protease/amidase